MTVENGKTVALIHSYGFNNSDEDRIRPDTRGRLNIMAGLELLRNNEIDYLYFNGGQIDPNLPPIAEVMAEHAKEILPQKAESIIASPTAHNTVEEITGFYKQLDGENIQKTIHIASETHAPRIQRSINRTTNTNTSVQTLEDILTKKTRSNRYKELVDCLVNSDEEIAFKKQEAILNIIDSVPFVGPWFLQTLSRILANKYAFQSSVLKRME